MTKIINGTVLGAILGFCGGLLLGVLSIGAAALYYWFIFGIFLGLVPGAIVGAAISGVRSWYRQAISVQNEVSDRSTLARHTRIGAPILLAVIGLSTLVVSPLFFVGRTFHVTHEMRWAYDPRRKQDCPSAVALVYIGYAQYEGICSPHLAAYLESLGTDTVTATFRVTYDFGQVRGYSLERVGEYQLQLTDEWGGGAAGCGGQFLPECGSPEDTDARPFS